MKKSLLAIFFAILLLPITGFPQKAYDAIYYRGATQNITVKFTLADGYLAGCVLKTTDKTTKKTSTFLPGSGVPDENKQLKFYHSTLSGKTFTDYFIIDGMKELYEDVPGTISGKYYFNGKGYDVVLMRSKDARPK